MRLKPGQAVKTPSGEIWFFVRYETIHTWTRRGGKRVSVAGRKTCLCSKTYRDSASTVTHHFEREEISPLPPKKGG